MPKITEEGKLREKRGTGTGADYKPWIKIREVNSLGTASTVIDYKTGRAVELLSQGEVYYYYMLRWDDTVEDIREQFPLDLEKTLDIADQLNVRHPRNRSTRMTTDLLVTRVDGSLEAYCIKSDRSVFTDLRTCEKLCIEKLYWELQGISFHICLTEDVTKDKVNEAFVQNIMDVVSCYDPSRIQDAHGMIRYLIAHKKISVEMSTHPLDYMTLISQYQQLIPQKFLNAPKLIHKEVKK